MKRIVYGLIVYAASFFGITLTGDFGVDLVLILAAVITVIAEVILLIRSKRLGWAPPILPEDQSLDNKGE